ncbi:hypothetical protein ACFS7Z_22790 [Pontibacter toksunensis]|uniref:Uncharacterized protein n=1 Tax=Pontibacter toksunensis TaxID=1332631 RepID=A0ABW6C1T9_9BACT
MALTIVQIYAKFLIRKNMLPMAHGLIIYFPYGYRNRMLSKSTSVAA